MKRPVLILTFILSVFLLKAQMTQLNMAADYWPPFTDELDKKAFASELVNEGLKRSGIKMSTEIRAFDNVIEGLEDGLYDGSPALWMSEERKNYLVFSNPYLENQLILVGKSGSDVTARSLAELTDKRIAIVSNYSYGTEVETAINVEFVEGGSDQANLKKLLSGKVDYMLVDALLIQHLLKNQEEEIEENLEVGDHIIIKKPLHFAIRKDFPDAERIIETFNKQILNMVVDGTYNRILELDWIKSDVDGDGIPEMITFNKNNGSQAPKSGYDVMLSNQQTPYIGKERYYINGKVYEGWDTVPQEFKLPRVTKQEAESMSIYKWKF